MIYRILLYMAILIFVLNYFVQPTFFDMAPDDTGLFVGLILLCIVIGHILNREK
ncbi:hypothetical protein [Salipaludibacillus daqingensis]|uniref:hypothetical protein n=1 Tax=Salipaludibacillus daqingensis TaxID=3041001 RepID=UPI002473858A|nr:hypothetical protein [Salipaludibacillus daqingensis]